jgi:hypothetical protein
MESDLDVNKVKDYCIEPIWKEVKVGLDLHIGPHLWMLTKEAKLRVMESGNQG